MRMLWANSRLSLAVLLAVFCHAQALEPSHHDNTPVHGLNDTTRCSWNCTIIDSDLMEEMQTIVARKNIIRLAVKYEKRVNDKCVDQTSRNSSGNITEHWQIWWANKQLSVFAKALKSVANLMSCMDSSGVHKEIRTICTLRPVNTTATKPTYYSGSSLMYMFSRSHLADPGVKRDSILCNTGTKESLQPCINITRSTGHNSSTFEGLFKRGGWPADVLFCLCLVFVVVFIFYSPALLCLFSPTEVTEDGVNHIVLDGASPVSLRSLMGNYFFSKEDTIWHRARMFILRAVVLPFTFLGPVMFTEYLQKNDKFPTSNILGVSRFWRSHMFVCSVCYYILAFYSSFFSPGSSKGNRPCLFCNPVTSQTIICQENLALPKKMINHLRIQPLILVECWGLFIRLVLNYFKTCFLLIPSSFEFSAIFFRRLFLFIVLLSTSPAVIIILLILMLLKVHTAINFTLYTLILCDIPRQHFYFHNPYLRLFSYFVCFSVAILAVLGTMRLLMFAGFGVLIAIISAFVLLLSEESLPFVACVVLFLYYIWSSFSSFTNEYQDLALALFKHYKSYKNSKQSQVTDMTLNTDSVLEITPNAVDNKDNVMKIPKKLFYMACEELMPIRERVCVLIVKVTIIVVFVLFVFTLIMLLDVGATPVMRALMTFITGSFPKIIAIYMDGGRQKKIEAMSADEKIPEIVRESINGTSGVNQRQENSGTDVDKEKLQNVNEENIELGNM